MIYSIIFRVRLLLLHLPMSDERRQRRLKELTAEAAARIERYAQRADETTALDYKEGAAEMQAMADRLKDRLKDT